MSALVCTLLALTGCSTVQHHAVEYKLNNEIPLLEKIPEPKSRVTGMIPYLLSGCNEKYFLNEEDKENRITLLNLRF